MCGHLPVECGVILLWFVSSLICLVFWYTCFWKLSLSDEVQRIYLHPAVPLVRGYPDGYPHVVPGMLQETWTQVFIASVFNGPRLEAAQVSIDNRMFKYIVV